VKKEEKLKTKILIPDKKERLAGYKKDGNKEEIKSCKLKMSGNKLIIFPSFRNYNKYL